MPVPGGSAPGVPRGRRTGRGGRDDPLYPGVRALHRQLPEAPVAGSYTGGRHNFGYWSTVVPAAFAFVAGTPT
ncbi:hypothetical protein [Dactylosporangium sp. NPDC000521]|uniref:hypothetical protein n=1 Tax=Dactylosporangium sp. NPDC000521 TaxID=3363975 RepID=UPI0036B6FF2C